MALQRDPRSPVSPTWSGSASSSGARRRTGRWSGLAASAAEPLRGRLALLRSLAVALSNPKSLLFFAAFLPQFVDTAQPQGPQYLLLGAIFVCLDTW